MHAVPELQRAAQLDPLELLGFGTEEERVEKEKQAARSAIPEVRNDLLQQRLEEQVSFL